jgi:hypothetical protein
MLKYQNYQNINIYIYNENYQSNEDVEDYV